MGKHTWEGWQTSVSNAPQPTSILFGANLKKSFGKESQETQQKPQSKDSESQIRNLENSLFQQMAQVQQPMQPDLPQPGPTRGEFPSQTQSSLALQEQGIQSASDKIKQLKKHQRQF